MRYVSIARKNLFTVYVAHKLIGIAHISEGRLSLERHNAEKEIAEKYTLSSDFSENIP
jgi:hypothetical protein